MGLAIEYFHVSCFIAMLNLDLYVFCFDALTGCKSFVHGSLVAISRADLLAFCLYHFMLDAILGVCVSFPFGVLGNMYWFLIIAFSSTFYKHIFSKLQRMVNLFLV